MVFPAIRLAPSSVIYSRITLYIFALNHICSKSRHSYSKSRHFCFKSHHFRSKSHHYCFKYKMKMRYKSLFVSAFNLEPATNSITLAVTEFCHSATNYSIRATFPGSAKTAKNLLGWIIIVFLLEELLFNSCNFLSPYTRSTNKMVGPNRYTSDNHSKIGFKM